MKKISFICCYTRPDLVEELKESVKDYSSFDMEWVLIDNSDGKYSSAAAALNAGFKKSTADVLVFLHHDIEFDTEATLLSIYREAMNGHVVGVAGRKENGGPLVTTITDGKNKERSHYYNFQSESEPVLACDECVLAMSRETYLKVGGFDEVNFDGWHFYGVDLCLRAKEKGITSVVVPTKLWHKSTGNHDKNWDFYEERLRRLYKDKYKVIYYPCGRCYTNYALYRLTKLLRPLRKRTLQKRRLG